MRMVCKKRLEEYYRNRHLSKVWGYTTWKAYTWNLTATLINKLPHIQQRLALRLIYDKFSTASYLTKTQLAPDKSKEPEDIQQPDCILCSNGSIKHLDSLDHTFWHCRNCKIVQIRDDTVRAITLESNRHISTHPQLFSLLHQIIPYITSPHNSTSGARIWGGLLDEPLYN